jgi:hypothetical protein
MGKLIKGALDALTKGEFSNRRRTFIKGLGAAGALTTLPKGAKKLMESVAKKLPKNLKETPAFKILQKDFFHKAFRANLRHPDFADASAFADDDEYVKKIFSIEDVHKIINKSIKNKMKATGESFDEVAGDFIESSKVMSNDIIESGVAKSDWIDFLNSSAEDWKQLDIEQLYREGEAPFNPSSYGDPYRPPLKDWNWELLNNEEVFRWMDTTDAGEALGKMQKAREIDPGYEVWYAKDDIMKDTYLEEWLEGKVPEQLSGRSLLPLDEDGIIDYTEFAKSIMEDYGLSKQELAEYLRKNKVIYQNLADDMPTPKVKEYVETD